MAASIRCDLAERQRQRVSLALRSLVLLAFVMTLASCAVNPGFEDPVEAALLDRLHEHVTTEEPQNSILSLSDSARNQIDQAVPDDWSQTRKFRALRRYLFDEDKRHILYEASATRTAEETLTAANGNCLSMSNLFVASARHVGLDARFQTVATRPTWSQSGLTLIRYEHIVAVGKLDKRDEYVVDFLPELSASGRGRRIISDSQALALYYSNLSAEAIVAGDSIQGVELGLKAISLWPDHSDSWNNIGAAYKRMGEKKLAELSYKRALKSDSNNYSALGNLTQFYLAEGREEEARRFLSRVKRYYRKNPYYYYYLASMVYSDAEYEKARRYLSQAIRIKRDDAEFYKALSDTYAKLGDTEKSAELAAIAAEVKLRKRRFRGERENQARRMTIYRFGPSSL